VKKSPAKKSAVKKAPPLGAFLTEIALGAGAIHMKYFRKKIRIQEKPGAGIVTEADLKSEAYLLKKIKGTFPSSEVITEESGLHKKAGNRFRWIIDPLDGTSNYAHGFPWFCVSIGVEDEGELVAGAIYHPVLKELFLAEKGKGAYLYEGKRRQRLQVSKTARMQDSLLGTGFYYFKGMELDREVDRFGRVCEQAQAVRRPGAAALDMAYVACGRYDGFWERGLSAWDVAAGFLLIQEAGGKVTDYAGKTVSVMDSEVLASNGILHGALSQILAGGKLTEG